ncbi:zinc finger protein 34-like isoform X2 [Petaurus breviceps papuanus]|uniref:zinc finger protein 34-like isoform X2 n=1 Tax=Petaurus breviceps papuanus TaxID=3040969 RepID=UPI0036DA3D5F
MGEEMIGTTDLTVRSQVIVKFEDVAVYLSKEEWELLSPDQKRLHREVMLENYENVVSVGTGILLNKPAMIVHLEHGAMAWSLALQRPRKKRQSRRRRRGDGTKAKNKACNPEQEINEDIGSQRMLSAGVSSALVEGPQFPEGSDCEGRPSPSKETRM